VIQHNILSESSRQPVVEDAHASKTVQAADQGGIHPIHALLNISAAAQSRKLKRRKVSRQFSTSASGVFRGFEALKITCLACRTNK